MPDTPFLDRLTHANITDWSGKPKAWPLPPVPQAPSPFPNEEAPTPQTEEPQTQERRVLDEPTFRVSPLFGELPNLSPQAQLGVAVSTGVGIYCLAKIIPLAIAFFFPPSAPVMIPAALLV